MSARWAMLVLGMWLAGAIVVSIVATQNFRTVDRLMTQSAHPQFLSVIERIGKPAARDFLRHLSSELNRLYFRLWNLSQLALGAVLLWLVWQSPSRVRIAVSLMLAIVVVMLVWLVPQVTSIGRSLDFVPRDPPPPALRKFWMLHGAYTGLETLKLAIGGVAAFWIGRSQP